ncbi:hypothetical protein A3Q56_03659 [Intoshia linei]|uniref:Uncharacterized protein n=1 Tax=Intoshia linei TaxID=1819745 RepID=A0A177B4R4_9BILA|nr:hypothetical protein A3Q56_03659 [Intoshia linei]
MAIYVKKTLVEEVLQDLDQTASISLLLPDNNGQLTDDENDLVKGMDILPDDVAEQHNNRTNSAPLISESIIKKQEKGCMNHINDASCLFCRWKDNAIVTVGSNFEGVIILKKLGGGVDNLNRKK